METPTIYLPSRLELKINLTDEQFWQLCQENDDLRFEKSATGELIIMSPTGGNTGKRNVKITTQLDIWNSQNNLGEVFDSNTGFILPNGSQRAPDASWLSREKWDTLTLEEQDKFLPLCPDFVVELMSPRDTLEKTRTKMREYIENGAKLGWLINRKKRQLEIYRPEQGVEILENPQRVSGENILPGFVLDLTLIW
ncbi:MAG: Uma2 family endonuclease [Okeania sp. SIO3I5]|uniref:Uma2 family endonuclease n=1 Tax=Okeania sp. SIO3I5 TaxID=2607805 RepID=UPI0013BC0FE5|nr:Uma2 family endonuclease [Okeania sp. SIO3I5]NEQ40311.1 Uma2 family endonuclease [Okeania sp. SIO3I5]